MLKRYLKSMGLLLVLMMVLSSFTGCTSTNTGQQLVKGQYQNIDVSSIDIEKTLGIIQEFSSEKYKGRLAGTPENDMIVDYIANYFKEIGLESPNQLVDYRQPFNQSVLFTDRTPTIRIEDANGNTTTEFKYLMDYRILNIWQGVKIKGTATGEMVLIDDKKQLNKDNQELEGKVLLIDAALVDNQNIAHDLLGDVLKLDKSIKGIIFNHDNRRNASSYLVSTVTSYGVEAADNEEGPVVAMVTNDVFEEFKKAQQEDLKVYLEVDFSCRDVEVSNVVGVIPGQDEALKDEYIIITGHFDHVGDNKDGTYQPGALDNASGTAAMMEIARVLKENKVTPKKTIVFIGFNGEEEGLYGSQHYAYNNPIFPLENSTVINMDMVGSDDIIPLTIGGSSRELTIELVELAKEMGMEVDTSTDIGSDQRPFNKKSVQAVTLIHRDLEKIHTYMDDMTNVDGVRLAEVIRLVLRYIDGEGY
ncbi:M28 family metallopeptidase [Alkaliphilus hydrothermalis]|uniref:Peptidase M28 domain-containing protein n=1 Tax=Alkaliphilus hydrothermalis TaxID=1482730 RepID=A0ABS2NNQ9_9FIRM|nr:M28 family metallopeptidase [Alkaliphilus hydrothermalis]MBM7614561.1 hypothetical protein [Alkaliphilus hydrothermalis]